MNETEGLPLWQPFYFEMQTKNYIGGIIPKIGLLPTLFLACIHQNPHAIILELGAKPHLKNMHSNL